MKQVFMISVRFSFLFWLLGWGSLGAQCSVSINPPTPGCIASGTVLTATGPYYQYTWSNGDNGNITRITGSGTYTVTVTNFTDCTVTASITLNNVLQVDNIITNNLSGSFRLRGGLPQSNGSNYTAVAMQLFNNPAVTATLNTAPFTHNETVSFTVPQAGAYVVTVTDGAGCTATAMITPVICNPVSDSLELVKLYNATNGPGWTNKTNWLVPGMPISTWHGVVGTGEECVRDISLTNNNLSGFMPNLNLPNLQLLELDNNQLSGSIPNFNLPNVQFLYLGNNQLSGTIPNFSLPNLKILRLTINQLSGTIPNFSLPNLQELELDLNQLSGSIPNFSLPNLQLLLLDNNQLSGSIPNFSLPFLQSLSLNSNQLSGTIPNFSLPNLIAVGLYNNQLSGTIPGFNLPNLQFLYFSDNQLSGSIPDFNLPSLKYLYLDNNQLSGTIPNFTLSNLQNLLLNNNQLSGSIPNFNLPNLTSLHLRNNNLSTAPLFTQMPLLGTSTSSFDSLVLQNNHLTFDDILPNMPLINGFNGGKAKYAPQDSIFSDTLITRTTGQALTIDLGIDAGLATNAYQWYKNGQLWTPPAGNSGNSNKLVFTNLQNSDAGTYHVRVTNPGAPALTLYSRAINLDIAAATCTVTTTANSGPGSLREAINCANSNPGPDTIKFNIPGAGPHIISPVTALPEITKTTVLDATTQPGWALGRIVLDGTATPGNVEGLTISYNSGSAVYGMVIRNFKNGRGLNCYQDTSLVIGAPGKGNAIYGNADLMTFSQHEITVQECVNTTIQGNIIGLSETLTLVGDPQDAVGIGLEGKNIKIGGDRSANEGNRFGGTFWGINAYDGNNGFTPKNYQIYGNDFGVQDSSALRCNTGIGVIANIDSFQVGNGTLQQRNRFFSQKIGVSVFSANNPALSIRYNEFFCNDSIAIERVDLPAPVISSASPLSISGTTAAGAVVEVYLSNPCTGKPCQGYARLGVTTANAAGQWTLNAPFENTATPGLNATALATLIHRTSPFATCVPIVSTTCNPTRDRQALTQIYNALNGPNWPNQSGWLTAPDLNDWYGVITNAQGCVTHLDMDGNQFVGYAWSGNPPGNNLVGTLPPAIGALSELEWMSLSGNIGLTGTVPDTIRGLKQLYLLGMRSCGLNGPLPAGFFALSALADCDFADTPWNMPLVPEWGNLTNMESLILPNAGLYGAVPPEMAGMDSLYVLDLNNNGLEGSFPTGFTQLSNVQALLLGGNSFENIPDFSAMPFEKKLLFTVNQVEIWGNTLTFEDILPNMPLSQIAPGFLYYHPQDSIFTDTTIARSIGHPLTIDLGIDASLTTNVYQWFKNGQPWTPPAGNSSNSNKLVFTNLQSTDAGTYRVRVTNPGAPALTLYSRAITLQVTPIVNFSPDMVYVQGGTFTMGCTSEQQPYCYPPETPVHEVTLTDFYMGKYEVTQEQWANLLGYSQAQVRDLNSALSPLFGEGNSHPVYYVSWFDAIVFCNKLSEQNGYAPCYFADAGYTQVFGKNGTAWTLPSTGTVYWKPGTNGYRLPTEAEWEYAARGGILSNGYIYAGSNDVNAVAWYQGNANAVTHPVGEKNANELGIFDMSGNLYEWCYDWHDDAYYNVSPPCAPVGPTASTNRRVARGGSWIVTAIDNRVSYREDGHPPASGVSDSGFRLCRTP